MHAGTSKSHPELLTEYQEGNKGSLTRHLAGLSRAPNLPSTHPSKEYRGGQWRRKGNQIEQLVGLLGQA